MKIKKLLTPTIVLLSAVLSTGCMVRDYGILLQAEDFDPIVLPEAVKVGETFTVIVTTRGGGCIKFGDSKVEIEGMIATVSVYDWYNNRDQDCSLYLALHQHKAEITFNEIGTATLNIVARESSGLELLTTVTVRNVLVY